MNKNRIEMMAQADLLLLSADLLRPPEKNDLLSAVSLESLRPLVQASGLRPRNELARDLIEAFKQMRATPRDIWSGEYRRLFDGVIDCPVNEAALIRRDKGAIIGDLCGFYRAFGWEPNQGTGERPDHLLVELEFCAMLLVMRAQAENAEQREITRSALAEFTRAHLNDWLPVFCEQLPSSSRLPLFTNSAKLLASTWNSLVAYHQWVVDPAPLPVIGICDEPENPYECGAPDLVELDARRSDVAAS